MLKLLALDHKLHEFFDTFLFDVLFDECIDLRSEVVRYLFDLSQHFFDLFLGFRLVQFTFLEGLFHKLGGTFDGLHGQLGLILEILEDQFVSFKVLIIKVFVLEETSYVV